MSIAGEASEGAFKVNSLGNPIRTPHARSRMVGRVLPAHAVGLSVTGMAGTIGTAAGFSPGGAFLGLFLGGVISVPWMIALAVVIWFRGAWLEQHPFVFAAGGPLLVMASWFALSGTLLLEFVAISCVTSSVVVLLLTLWSGRVRAPAIEGR